MTINIKSKLFLNLIKLKNLVNLHAFRSFSSNYLIIYYSDFTKNWGDYVNPFLISMVTGKKVLSAKRIFNLGGTPSIYGIGSILQTNLHNSVIWGSGFIQCPEKKITKAPKKILAVRGKLTAEIFEKNGIQHDGVYGDPALLFPEFFAPERSSTYKLGIVPHYTEVELFKKSSLINDQRVLLINPMVEGMDYKDIIRKLNKCENILASSLHGLILGDAYRIPTLRLRFPGNSIIGGNFKFDDYYSGVGIDSHSTYTLENIQSFDLDEICAKTKLQAIKFDSERLKEVLLNYLNER